MQYLYGAFQGQGEIYNVLSNNLQISKGRMLLPNASLQGGIWIAQFENIIQCEGKRKLLQIKM